MRDQRCVVCHNAQVQHKNVALDTPEAEGSTRSSRVPAAAVLRQMPLNNATQITDADRPAGQAGWYESAQRLLPVNA